MKIDFAWESGIRAEEERIRLQRMRRGMVVTGEAVGAILVRYPWLVLYLSLESNKIISELGMSTIYI